MKVIYTSRSSLPSTYANSIQVMKMCEAMARLGHDVTLLACCKTANIADIYNFYGVEPIFTIKHLPLHKGEKANFNFILKSLGEVLKAKPDLVYGRVLESCLLSALFGLDVCYEAHKFPKRKMALFSSMIFFRLPKFKRLVVITKALGEMFREEFNIPKKKIVVAHDGADSCKENGSNAHLQLNNGNFHVGYVGNLYPGKGMELIARMAYLAPWASFHIVGGSKEDINYWKKELQHLANIYFYGFVPHHETRNLMKLFHVALLPVQPKVKNNFGSTDTGDNISPLKLFEYMASGLPILASDLPSIREVLTDGENAILLPPDNVSTWHYWLEILKKDDNLRKKLGEKAKKHFLQNYTWEARANKVLAGL